MIASSIAGESTSGAGQAAQQRFVRANGTDLYCEVRGGGPPVLLISGATGDAGHFTEVANLLADEFTVVTYDRRGNSRSPRPAGWATTSIEEQADDAAGLLGALQLAPAAVFGTSLSAPIALELTLRHPEVVRTAILHEPVIFLVLDRPEAATDLRRATVGRGIAAGGPRGGLEALLRLAWGNATFDRLDPQLRERILGNADVALNVEAPCYGYRPDEAKLASIAVLVHVVTAAQSPEGGAPVPFFTEVATWLATRLRSTAGVFPGHHGLYLNSPPAFTGAIRPLLSEDSPRR